MAITREVRYAGNHDAHSDYGGNGTLVDTAPQYVANGGWNALPNTVFNNNSEGIYWTLSGSIAQGRGASLIAVTNTVIWISDTPSVFSLFDGGVAGTLVLDVYFTATTIYAYAGATQLGTWAGVNDLLVRNGYRHLGFDFKADASSGWFYLYLDGTAIISYTGQTNQGASTFDTFCFGPHTSSDNFYNLYTDGCYFDNTTGEGSAAIAPLVWWKHLRASADGNYSEWVGSDGNSVNNYQLIDESYIGVNTADYVQGTTTGDQDSYNILNTDGATYDSISDITGINGVLVEVVALEEAATSEQYRPFLRYSSTDSTGTAIDLTTSYDFYQEIFTTPPGGGSWTRDIIDSTEIGIEVV